MKTREERSSWLTGSRTPLSAWIASGIVCSLLVQMLVGCAVHRGGACEADGACRGSGSCGRELSPYLQIESPQLCDRSCDSVDELIAGPPPTLKDFETLQPWDLTLEEAIQAALSNAKVLNRLGGAVVAAPQGAMTVFDPAIQATHPAGSAEAALSAFDARWSANVGHNHDEQAFNNPIQESFLGRNSYGGDFNTRLVKTTATGAEFGVATTRNYNRNDAVFNTVPSFWTLSAQAELRQPLLRNAGTAVNRIAGPNAVPGSYNGVLLARIREDVTLTAFEANVIELVESVATTYWQLYFAYQDFDTLKRARDAARQVWENRKGRQDVGEDRPDEEALSRQQYFSFQNQVEDALVGLNGQTGVYGTERQLRRLMGLPTRDGRLIRPATEPTLAEVVYDWDSAQQRAMGERVELRQQKWRVRQRELELCAAKNLALWRLDFVGAYGARGVGDNWFGTSSGALYSANKELLSGDLDSWQFGLELQGPVGNRLGHLGIRNAQLSLCREKAVLREQQRQILHDLGAAYSETDRAFAAIKTIANNRAAVLEELGAKSNRAQAGLDDVFFLLEALQRATRIESSLHRAVTDYNLALLRFSVAEGQLLPQFNVNLVEDAVGEDSSGAAVTVDQRVGPRRGRVVSRGGGPVSGGPFAPSRPPSESSTVSRAEQPRPIYIDETATLNIALPRLGGDE